MPIFSKKHSILFISKYFVDPGSVTVGKGFVFNGFEAIAYTADTLADVLKRTRSLFKGNIRIVLSEELVYTAGLTFPIGTSLTRTSVAHAVEETIPEDLRTTEWDFQTLRYAKKQETATEILVQAAVIESKFFRILKQAFEAVSFPVESIVSESYALAKLAAGQEGVVLLVARNRTGGLLCAVENGFVIATRIKRDEITPSDAETFLSFIVEHTTKKVQKIIFSYFSEENLKAFQKLSADGYELIREDYNPLIGAALNNTTGQDAEVLNLNAFLLHKRAFRFRRFFKKLLALRLYNF